jgi:hypothetical protein
LGKELSLVLGNSAIVPWVLLAAAGMVAFEIERRRKHRWANGINLAHLEETRWAWMPKMLGEAKDSDLWRNCLSMPFSEK